MPLQRRCWCCCELPTLSSYPPPYPYPYPLLAPPLPLTPLPADADDVNDPRGERGDEPDTV